MQKKILESINDKDKKVLENSPLSLLHKDIIALLLFGVGLTQLAQAIAKRCLHLCVAIAK
jgi:hypothetical protein